jgi:hypothetical protein
MEPGAMHKEKEEELNQAPKTRAKAAWPKSGGAKMYANKGGKWFFEKKEEDDTYISSINCNKTMVELLR